jgi:hypothetical protein
MNATASIPTMEAPHHGNLVAPFLGCTCKGPGTEGELRGFEVSFWTSRDCFGPADPSNPWHLGKRVGNHSMWQAANLVETEGPAGNSVAVSATKIPSEEVPKHPRNILNPYIPSQSRPRRSGRVFDRPGHLGEPFGESGVVAPRVVPQPSPGGAHASD